MANKKDKKVAKVEPKAITTKTDVIKQAMDKVAAVKSDAQARYDAAMAGLVIVRN